MLETIGVVFMLMLQSVRNYWSDIYVNVSLTQLVWVHSRLPWQPYQPPQQPIRGTSFHQTLLHGQTTGVVPVNQYKNGNCDIVVILDFYIARKRLTYWISDQHLIKRGKQVYVKSLRSLVKLKKWIKLRMNLQRLYFTQNKKVAVDWR